MSLRVRGPTSESQLRHRPFGDPLASDSFSTGLSFLFRQWEKETFCFRPFEGIKGVNTCDAFTESSTKCSEQCLGSRNWLAYRSASNYGIIITTRLQYNNNLKYYHFSGLAHHHFLMPEVPELSRFTVSILDISVIFSRCM